MAEKGGSRIATPSGDQRVHRVQELRRSNAARPHRNRKRYSRKVKHRGRPE